MPSEVDRRPVWPPTQGPDYWVTDCVAGTPTPTSPSLRPSAEMPTWSTLTNARQDFGRKWGEVRGSQRPAPLTTPRRQALVTLGRPTGPPPPRALPLQWWTAVRQRLPDMPFGLGAGGPSPPSTPVLTFEDWWAAAQAPAAARLKAIELIPKAGRAPLVPPVGTWLSSGYVPLKARRRAKEWLAVYQPREWRELGLTDAMLMELGLDPRTFI
jgi:hypothetical protein